MNNPIEARCYRWNDLTEDRPMELLSRKRIIGSQVMLSHVTLRRGCIVPMHQHANEQMACVVSGVMKFTLKPLGGGKESVMTLRAGQVLHLPADVPHAAEAIEDSLVLDVFSPPSEKTGIDQT